MRVLHAVGREHQEGRNDLATELAARQATPGRVSLDGYLEDLGVDQAAGIVRLADPARPLDTLVGPAGFGKTTSLARLVKAHQDAGRQVRVLAPTAVAAGVLGEAVGVPGDTLHKAMGEWRDGRNPRTPGSLILVDEASMATTGLLVEVADLARSNGAMLRLVGDPRQLRAVGAGGGLQISQSPPR